VIGDEPVLPAWPMEPCDRCGQNSSGPWSWYAGPELGGRGAALYASICPDCRTELFEVEPAAGDDAGDDADQLGEADPLEVPEGRQPAPIDGDAPAAAQSSPINPAPIDPEPYELAGPGDELCDRCGHPILEDPHVLRLSRRGIAQAAIFLCDRCVTQFGGWLGLEGFRG